MVVEVVGRTCLPRKEFDGPLEALVEQSGDGIDGLDVRTVLGHVHRRGGSGDQPLTPGRVALDGVDLGGGEGSALVPDRHLVGDRAVGQSLLDEGAVQRLHGLAGTRVQGRGDELREDLATEQSVIIQVEVTAHQGGVPGLG